MSTSKPTVREGLIDTARFADSDPRIDSIEQRFFSRLRLSNGVYKTTYVNRFADLNALLIQHLQGPRLPLDVLDVAVSSGVSTAELSETLDEHGLTHRIFAGDKFVSVEYLECGRGVGVLREPGGYVIQYDAAGRGFTRNAKYPQVKFFVSWILFNVLDPIASLYFQRVLDDGRYGLPSCVGEVCAPRLHRLDLVSRHARRKEHIEIHTHDVMEPPAEELRGRFALVRAANILNRDYFSVSQLHCAVSNLRECLTPGGILAICRTHNDASNHADVFRLGDAGGLELVGSLGTGSEIRDIVLGL